MKRTSMTAAILAGIAGVAGISNMANAVYLNPDGLGSVLIYPYYTVNGGNATLLSVVNTTNEGKAVKVRFLEAYNSREVLDFNLYLSPFDVWVAQVAANMREDQFNSIGFRRHVQQCGMLHLTTKPTLIHDKQSGNHFCGIGAEVVVEQRQGEIDAGRHSRRSPE